MNLSRSDDELIADRPAQTVVNELRESDSDSCLSRAMRAGVLLAASGLAATALANAVIASNAPSLSGRLSGGFNRVPLRFGDAAYFVSGSGLPVLLLHAPRPGNSSAEWEENFDALARRHTVYALDFLGWGLSDKPPHILRPQDYAEQIEHFIADVIGAPCAVIASGEAGNFALQAAHKAPDLFSKLILICPSSFEADESEVEVAYEAKEDEKPEKSNPRYRLFTAPIIGEALLNFLHSRAKLETFAAQNLFFDKTRVTPGRVSRLHVASHQPGSQNALAAHAAGLLASDWREAWSTLSVPALLVWGRNAPAPGIETAPEWLALKPDAHLEVFDQSLLLPHVEHAEQFNARVLQWLS